jgi:hypothetical protein
MIESEDFGRSFHGFALSIEQHVQMSITLRDLVLNMTSKDRVLGTQFEMAVWPREYLC